MADTELDYRVEAWLELHPIATDDDDLTPGERAALLAEEEAAYEARDNAEYAAYLAAEALQAAIPGLMDLGPRDRWLTPVLMSDCGHWVGDLCEQCTPF